MKMKQLLLTLLLCCAFLPLCHAEATLSFSTHNEELGDLPDSDDTGDAFRSFEDSLRSYEDMCDQIPIEENPRWKIWLARGASTIYGRCLTTKK